MFKNLQGEIANYSLPYAVEKKQHHKKGAGAGQHKTFPEVVCEKVRELGFTSCLKCPLDFCVLDKKGYGKK